MKWLVAQPFCLGLVLMVASVVQADRYVWSNSPHPGAPYDAWMNAAHDVQTAINVASNETVWVTNGTYTVTSEISVPAGITLRGGEDRSATILQGGYPATTNRIINLSGGVVHGFTITNGFVDVGGGGGVYIGADGGTISNCTIVGNSVASSAATSSAPYGGGGVCMYYAVDGLVEDCDILANRSVGTGGKSQGGGGLLCYGKNNSTIRNCLIANNESDYEGGGVYHNVSALLEGCVISNNVGNTKGGGVYLRNGARVRNCDIVNNVVNGDEWTMGGGVFFHNSGSISNCTIRGNLCAGDNRPYGGGAYIQHKGDILDCTITENEAGRGGGVYSTGNASNVGGFISNCLISGNTTGRGEGGGLYFTSGMDGGGLAVNCTIVSNVAGRGAGVRFLGGGRVRNCLIAANEALWEGGGLRGTVTGGGYAESCTIVRNSAGTGGGAYLVAGSLTNCIVWHNMGIGTTYDPLYTNLYVSVDADVAYSCSPDLTEGSAGNIAGVPYFKQAGAGSGLSATLGDYRLSGRSPCIDTGINMPWMIAASDFEGNKRVYPTRGRVDLGVYEDRTPRGTLLLLRTRFIPVALQPQRSLIVLPEQATSTQHYAALELQKHLAILTGVTISIGDTPEPDTYIFYIGTQPPGASDVLLPEEARWTVDTESAWFHGEDTETLADFPYNAQRDPSFCLTLRRTGTLTAVYDFLEKQFGVLWTEPGDVGIFFPEGGRTDMRAGSGTWHPGEMRQRVMRSGMAKNVESYNEALIDPFHLDEAALKHLRDNTHTWLKRQRMGNNMNAQFGHAFTRWWEQYGETHPEYFALVDGKREPKYAPDRIKMCVSNPALHSQIVANWQASEPLSEFINVCENDSGNYCECNACRALDMPPEPGKEWDEDLTDRYVYFANQVSALARAIKPDVTVCYYAYSVYRFPPQREHVVPGTLIGFVPGSVFDYAETEEMYDRWQEAGATQLFLRPNYQHVDCGLPMGFEKLYVDLLKLGFEKGIIGTDFDSMHNFWPTSGMGDYMVARIMNNRKLTYDQLLDEYSQIYGAAASDFKAFKAYWQEEICQKRLIPNREAISEKGRYGNFRRGLMWDLDKYYTLEDFDRTDAILAAGAKKELSPVERERLVRLQLANQHSRMTYEAVVATGDARLSKSQQLLDFRIAHRETLNIDWRCLIYYVEGRFGDVAGVNAAWQLRDF